MSEAFASTNPQCDDRLFIKLHVQYLKIPSLNLGRTCCVQKLFMTFRTISEHNMFSPCSAERRASDKDLPVMSKEYFINAEGFTPWMKNKKLRQMITPDTANNQTEITIEKYAQEEKASKPHRLVLSFLNGQLPSI